MELKHESLKLRKRSTLKPPPPAPPSKSRKPTEKPSTSRKITYFEHYFNDGIVVRIFKTLANMVLFLFRVVVIAFEYAKEVFFGSVSIALDVFDPIKMIQEAVVGEVNRWWDSILYKLIRVLALVFLLLFFIVKFENVAFIIIFSFFGIYFLSRGIMWYRHKLL